MKRTIAAAILLAAALFAQAPAGPDAAAARARAAVIGPEDTITISVLNAEEFSKQWRVGASGELNLPMLGRVRAAGLTVEEFERDLDRRLRKYYHNPQVSVYVSEFRSQPVTVVGPVEKPGAYQLQGSRSLFDVLIMAGGPKPAAGETVTLSRPVERGGIEHPSARSDETGKFNMVELKLEDVMEGRGAAAAIEVQPHDVVSVSEYKPQRMVHIAGEVARPGAVELVHQDTVSLLKVVAVAGGLTRTASPRRTMIVHLNEQGVQTSTTFVNLKKILSGKARDLELTAGDLIFVPTNNVMSYLHAASVSAVTTGILVLARF